MGKKPFWKRANQK